MNLASTKSGDSAHVSIAHAVTASPSLRHASGFLSFLLHSMNALLCFEHRAAKCFEIDMRTADVGGGVSSSDAISKLSDRTHPNRRNNTLDYNRIQLILDQNRNSVHYRSSAK